MSSESCMEKHIIKQHEEIGLCGHISLFTNTIESKQLHINKASEIIETESTLENTSTQWRLSHNL